MKMRQEYTAIATLTVDTFMAKGIKCKIQLPGRMGNVKIHLYPMNDIWNNIQPYFKFKFDAYIGDSKFHSDEAYVIKSECKYYSKEVNECYVELQANDFFIADTVSWEIESCSSIIFWISPNDKIQVPQIINQMNDGTVEVNHCNKENFKFKLHDDIFVQFDKMYDYEKKGKGYAASPYLIAIVTGNIAITNLSDVLLKIKPMLDEFLLLISFAFRTCIVWTGFELTLGNHQHCTYYRGNCLFPDGKGRPSIRDGVVEFREFKNFMDHIYPIFKKSTYKESLKHAIYVLCPGNSQNIILEENYLILFAALEAIVLTYRRTVNREFILSKDECKSLNKAVKNTIHHEVKDKIKRGELYSKLPELNRVALRTVFDDFCKDNSIDLSSLWPVFEKSDHKPGLSDIRNKLVHGDTQEMLGFLSYAHEHLQYVLERIVCSLLNWPLERTEINSGILKREIVSVNKFLLIKEDAEKQFKT